MLSAAQQRGFTSAAVWSGYGAFTPKRSCSRQNVEQWNIRYDFLTKGGL